MLDNIKLTIYDEKCPVCEGVLEIDKVRLYKFAICKNKCYAYDVYSKHIEVAFFLEEWMKTILINGEIVMTEGIRELLEYWKKDYRYLAKILEES